MYYAMLGGNTALPPSTECPPYTMPDPLDADQDLSSPLVLTVPTAININLCEEFV